MNKFIAEYRTLVTRVERFEVNPAPINPILTIIVDGEMEFTMKSNRDIYSATARIEYLPRQLSILRGDPIDNNGVAVTSIITRVGLWRRP